MSINQAFDLWTFPISIHVVLFPHLLKCLLNNFITSGHDMYYSFASVGFMTRLFEL